MNTAYLIQGLRGNTLVAGKTTALKIITAPWPTNDIAAVQLTIVRPDGSIKRLTFSKTQLVMIDVGGNKESAVALIQGFNLSDVGNYFFQVNILTAIGSVAATYLIDNVQFFPTKDLRMMVSRVWSGTGPAAKPNEVDAAVEAMRRLSFLYPIRDGISTLDGDYNSGLRYNFDNTPQGPPKQDGNLGPSWDKYQKPAAGNDTIDAAIAYRFPDISEGSGASTQPTYNGWLPWSLIVWEGPIPQVFCHETGHNHGLESPTSIHFDPTGQASHSKDLTISTSDASDGFDIQFNRLFPSQTFDVMFPTGPAPGYNPEQISMNSWDWEFLRMKLLSRASTGPHEPFISWQSLNGHDLLGYPCAARNRDGRIEVFVLGGDRAIYHIWEKIPGGEWSDWSTLEGHDLQEPIIAFPNSDGLLQIFVVGADGKLYSRAQNIPNGNWDQWFTLGGDQIKGFSVARNSDRRLELVAVFGDGQLYDIWQVAPNGAWSGWASLAGHDLKGPVSLTSNADGRLEAFVVGGDGNVYHRWQIAQNGWSGWSGWANLIDPRLVKVSDLKSELAGDGRIFVILMTVNKSISYLAQSFPNGGWGAAVDLYGHNLSWPCALGRSDEGRLEVAVIGGDKKLYSRWQVDISRSDLWTNWTPLGGKDIHPGVSLISNYTGQLEIFVIGGDGKLYRGPR